ncbi:MAG: vanadium-dependent haloperoxidase [Cyclobacteriaceae bacterium]|jgi:hypothetical protein|nr:vanadium-dependent haloperoxidase [Cyclobacteriaceae bacterium]
MKKISFLGCAIVLVIPLACQNTGEYKQKTENPEFLHRTMRVITDRIVHDIFSPPVASRIYAYTSVAGYEAIRHGHREYLSLADQLTDLTPVPSPVQGEEYSFTIAATQAMFKVGRTLVFSEDQMDEFYKQLTSDFEATGIPGDVLERSLMYGDQVADHIIAWSNGDNYKQTRTYPKYSIEKDPATWKPTPPTYMDAVEPHWNKIRPFVIDSAAQFKPKPPTPFSTDKNSLFFKEASEVYEVVKNITDEQKEIASFWDCNPFMMNVRGHVMFATKKISPGGHWINITRVACTKAKTDAMVSAEAYVLVSLALIDGFISCWDEKYRSKLIRPESYINQYIDENWLPILQTPPFPEYTSGHSVISGAASVALTGVFGDNFAFVDSTEVDFGLPVRSYVSFNQAAEEAAISRMYGGIHYRPAVEEGLKEGKALGEFVRQRLKTREQTVAKK